MSDVDDILAGDGFDPATSFVRLRVFLAEADAPIDYVVEGLLPVGGLSLLAAKPKVGKSTLARYLASSVARGVPCLGRATNPGPVLYVSIEERRRDVRAHFALLGSDADLDLDLHVHVGPVPGTPAGAGREAIRRHRVAWLTAEIRRFRPVLVIIDTWGRFVAVKDGNDYAEATEASEPLIALARDSSTHLLFTHHAKKGDAELIDSLLGSTAIAGSVDIVLLERRHKDKTRTLESNQRIGDELDEQVLVFDKHAGTLALEGTLEEARLQDVIRRILVCLGPRRWMTQKELRLAIDVKVDRLVSGLREAVRRQVITRAGAGKRGDPYRYAVWGTSNEKGERDDGNERDERDENHGGDSVSPVSRSLFPARFSFPKTSDPKRPASREPGEEG
jgi:AAA domain